jgi:hypothetical protein
MAVSTLVWNEFIHERDEPAVRVIYPDGIHSTIASRSQRITIGQPLATDAALHVSTATLDQPEHGLPQTLLDQTDVLLWWSTARTTRCRTRSPCACNAGSPRGMGLAHWREPAIGKCRKSVTNACSLAGPTIPGRGPRMALRGRTRPRPPPARTAGSGTRRRFNQSATIAVHPAADICAAIPAFWAKV